MLLALANTRVNARGLPQPPALRLMPDFGDRDTDMKRTNQCPKCGSSDIIADAKAIDRAHNGAEAELSVATFRNPDAAIFTGQSRTTLSAWVCAGCGYVEFYADSPQSISGATP